MPAIIITILAVVGFILLACRLCAWLGERAMDAGADAWEGDLDR